MGDSPVAKPGGVLVPPTHRAVFTIRTDLVLVLTIRHAAQADLTDTDLP